MSVLYANFSITSSGKKRLELEPLSTGISGSINDRLSNYDERLKAMAYQATFTGRSINISETSTEIIKSGIHSRQINKENSGDLTSFLANFYNPNELDIVHLKNVSSGPDINLNNLNSFFNPTSDVLVGINLDFPGSSDIAEENSSRLSAYIILWNTIISKEPNISNGGRKRLSRVRHSSNNKRRKTRRRPSTKRHTRHTRRTTRRR
jgi:hypothetical protein